MEGIREVAKRVLIMVLGLSLAAAPAFAQRKKKAKVIKAPPQPAVTQASAEPDKVLYERGLLDIKHGRYTEGRLALQTLINTYPDSEYLAKAKLATGDSYYKEGGTSNLTQAIAEYGDFTTFFPFLEEAAYAQMQIAMCHYRMMEKADRDDEQALEAEDAYQSFILKYPQSPLVPQADQRLREVQEVLAQGEFEIAHYYYTKPYYPAAAARLVELTERYPLFSKSDEALFMLGDIYQKARTSVKNEDQKNHWADLSAKCYDRILTDYPVSKRAAESKRRLQEMGMPVPSADPTAYERLAREQKLAQAQQPTSLLQHPTSFLKMPLSLFDSKPDVEAAAHYGAPNLNPPSDAISATDVLRPDAAGPQFNLATQSPAADDSNATTDSGAQVDVAPGGSLGAGGTTGVAAQIISTGPNSQATPDSGAPVTGASDPASSGTNSDIPTIVPQAVSGTDGSPAPANAPSTAGTTPAAQGSTSPPASTSAPQASSTTGQNANASATAASSGDSSGSSSESTSKKKKGLRKLVPW